MIQPTPNSSVLPVNTAAAPAATVVPAGTQQSSPFAALFQSNVESTNQKGNLPVPGKPQDSAREPESARIKLGAPGAPFAGIASLFFAPSLRAPASATPISLSKKNAVRAPQTAPAVNNPLLQPSSAAALIALQISIPPQVFSAVAGRIPGVTFPLETAAAPANGLPAGVTQALTALPGDTQNVALATPNLSASVTAKPQSVLPAQPSEVSPADALVAAPATENPISPAAPSQNGVASPSRLHNVQLNGLSAKEALTLNPHAPDVGSKRADIAVAKEWSPDSGSAQHARSQIGSAQPRPEAVPGPADVPNGSLKLENFAALLENRPGVNFSNRRIIAPAQGSANSGGPDTALPQNKVTALPDPPIQSRPSAATLGSAPQGAGKNIVNEVSAAALHTSVAPRMPNQPISPSSAASGSIPQRKDASNNSPGNGANAKQEQGSNGSGAASGTKVFAQTIESVSPSHVPAHSPSLDAAAAAATTRIPAETRPGRADAGRSEETNGQLHQNLPATGAEGNLNVVSAARITDRAGQTEVRIEMQTESLGNLELRAHVTGNQIAATITVAHHDAQAILVTELPALHGALAEKNIHINSLIVSQGTNSSLGEGARGDGGQKNIPQSHAKPFHAGQGEPSPAYSEAPAEWKGAGHSNGRLSVLA